MKSTRLNSKEAMDDDFNTALAVSVLFELANEVNSTKSPELARQLKKLGEVLGLLQLNPEKFIKGAVEGVDAAWVEEMIQKRKDAKKNKDFGTADAIRQELKDKGIVLETSRAELLNGRRPKPWQMS